MLGLFNHIPALPCGTTATAPRQPGLHESVNVSGGEDTQPLTKSGNVATHFVRPFRLLPGGLGSLAPRALLSRLVRDAFSAPEAAEDLAGDWPAVSELQPSDCWPSEVVGGEYLRHGGDTVANPTQLSPGKFPVDTVNRGRS